MLVFSLQREGFEVDPRKLASFTRSESMKGKVVMCVVCMLYCTDECCLYVILYWCVLFACFAVLVCIVCMLGCTGVYCMHIRLYWCVLYAYYVVCLLCCTGV